MTTPSKPNSWRNAVAIFWKAYGHTRYHNWLWRHRVGNRCAMLYIIVHVSIAQLSHATVSTFVTETTWRNGNVHETPNTIRWYIFPTSVFVATAVDILILLDESRFELRAPRRPPREYNNQSAVTLIEVAIVQIRQVPGSWLFRDSDFEVCVRAKGGHDRPNSRRTMCECILVPVKQWWRVPNLDERCALLSDFQLGPERKSGFVCFGSAIGLFVSGNIDGWTYD